MLFDCSQTSKKTVRIEYHLNSFDRGMMKRFSQFLIKRKTGFFRDFFSFNLSISIIHRTPENFFPISSKCFLFFFFLSLIYYITDSTAQHYLIFIRSMNIDRSPFANQTASVPPLWHYATGTFSLLCLLCGLCSNGLVIFVFLR